MSQDEYERLVLRIIAAGIVIAVVEFIVLYLITPGGVLVAGHTAFFAGILTTIAVVIAIWFVTGKLRPKESEEATEEAPAGES